MSEILGFAAFLAVAFGLAAVFEWVIRRSPIKEPEPSRLDVLDQPSTGGRCTHCRRPVTSLVWVIVAEDLGGGLGRVCQGCMVEGIAKKWWKSILGANATVYDIAVAEAIGDLDDVDTLVEKWAQS